jgi:hypothetical protein
MSPPSDAGKRLYLVLQIAAAMCYVGHGAFGVLTKAAWVPFFAAFGIGRDAAYLLMPVVGTVDILLGLSVLVRPTKAALLYMAAWAVFTALLRPLAGQPFAETLERAGNYGVPLALLVIGLASFPTGRWLARIPPAALDAFTTVRVGFFLRATTATLLLGHGLLALSGKPGLVGHAAVLGLGPSAVTAQGAIEVALALAVLAAPMTPVLVAALAWKVATELLFPMTGDSFWEFVERGGSYGGPLALLVLRRTTVGATAPARSLGTA